MDRKICEICEKLFECASDIDICQQCLKTHTATCSTCGKTIPKNMPFMLCEDCLHEQYVECNECHLLIPKGLAAYHSGNPLPFCQNCFVSHGKENTIIHEYLFKPIPRFYGNSSGKRFYGVELEVSGGGKTTNNAQKILNIVNRTSTLAYIKSDNSVKKGFELVTHPMTLEYHRSKMPWQETLATLRQLGYSSASVNGCGMHVHTNCSAFGLTVRERCPRIVKFIAIIEHFWPEILLFSRRRLIDINVWAKPYGFNKSMADMYRAIIARHSRKSSVNVLNKHTVEVRIFQGTLRHQNILAAISLIEHICELTSVIPYDQIDTLSWSTFVKEIDRSIYPDLIQYLKENQLYVNSRVAKPQDV